MSLCGKIPAYTGLSREDLSFSDGLRLEIAALIGRFIAHSWAEVRKTPKSGLFKNEGIPERMTGTLYLLARIMQPFDSHAAQSAAFA